MKPNKGNDFNIKNFGERVDLEATTPYGFAGGVAYLVENNYNILFETVRTMGIMYVVSAVKGEEKVSAQESNQIAIYKADLENLEAEMEIMKNDYKKEIDSLKIENRTQKSQITRLKNKIEKMEKG